MAHIKVALDEHVRECDHCGAKNIKRTYKLSIPNMDKMYIGRICLSRVTGIDTSGNPHRARQKVEDFLNSLTEDELDLILLFEDDPQ